MLSNIQENEDEKRLPNVNQSVSNQALSDKILNDHI
jgi:hypothetical protein